MKKTEQKAADCHAFTAESDPKHVQRVYMTWPTM